jgi:acyl carrier protein
MEDVVRCILAAQARLSVDVSTLAESTDLYASGMSSYATVGVMLALEEAFGVEFPDELLRRETFSSIARIKAAVTELQSPFDGGF